MIQRIQTLFLFIVFAAGIAAFFLPIASFLTEKGYVNLMVLGIINDTTFAYELPDTLYLMIVLGLSTLIAFVTIFFYKRRMLQVKLIRFGILLNIIYLALIFFMYAPDMEEAIGVGADYLQQPGVYLIIVSVVFLLLASRFIIKDEKLIRSADRLR
jgi:hypothetical protein